MPAPGYKVCSRQLQTLRDTQALSHLELAVNSSTHLFLPSPFTYSPAGAAWPSHTHSSTLQTLAPCTHSLPTPQCKFINKTVFINKIGQTVLIRHRKSQTSRSMTRDQFFLSPSTCISQTSSPSHPGDSLFSPFSPKYTITSLVQS